MLTPHQWENEGDRSQWRNVKCTNSSVCMHSISAVVWHNNVGTQAVLWVQIMCSNRRVFLKGSTKHWYRRWLFHLQCSSLTLWMNRYKWWGLARHSYLTPFSPLCFIRIKLVTDLAVVWHLSYDAHLSFFPKYYHKHSYANCTPFKHFILTRAITYSNIYNII